MPRAGYEKPGTQIQVGMRFGRLVVHVVLSPREIGCVCDCGGKCATNKYDLRGGRTISCGCYRLEQATARISKQTYAHGRSNTHEHKHWFQMHRRCTDPKFPMFKKYGARGIKVADEWFGAEGFIRFLNHIGEAPSKLHTIDRIDNNGDYVPGNVRWATPKEQGRNRNDNHLITAFGKTQCIADWADEMKLTQGCILERIRRGWDEVSAVGTPLLRKRRRK